MSHSGSESSGSGTVILIVVVILVLLVLVVAVCGGLIYFFASASQEMVAQMQAEMEEQNRLAEFTQRSARVFLDDLRAGRVEQAYKSTTVEFQKGMKLEDLQDLLKKHPFLTQPQGRDRLNLLLVETDIDGHEFEATVPLPDGREAGITLGVRKVGEEWKVDRFVIVEGAAARPPP